MKAPGGVFMAILILKLNYLSAAEDPSMSSDIDSNEEEEAKKNLLLQKPADNLMAYKVKQIQNFFKTSLRASSQRAVYVVFLAMTFYMAGVIFMYWQKPDDIYKEVVHVNDIDYSR
jgi:hypothetical protein